MVIAQETAQSLAAAHWPLALPIGYPRKQQDVALPLMIPLSVEMVDVVAQRSPQRLFAEEDHFGQALLLDRPHPALRIPPRTVAWVSGRRSGRRFGRMIKKRLPHASSANRSHGLLDF